MIEGHGVRWQKGSSTRECACGGRGRGTGRRRGRAGTAVLGISGNRLGREAGGTESRVVGKTLTWPEKEEGTGEIVQQLHYPMFFQIISGFQLPAAACLHCSARRRC